MVEIPKNNLAKSELDTAYANKYLFIGWPFSGFVFFLISLFGVFNIGPAKNLPQGGLIIFAAFCLLTSIYALMVLKKSRSTITKIINNN